MLLINQARKVLKGKKKRIHEFWYLEYRRKGKIKKNTVLLESTHGRTFNGHLYYLAKELIKYDNLKINIVIRDPEELKEYLKDKGFPNDIGIIKHLSKEYCELLATSEYLINDTSFWPFFNKRSGQKYFNIWHGTPLKTLGKDMEVLVDVANVQRNFYMADKLIVSNEYTKNILVDSYNLTGIYSGDVVVAPSPRNSILFDQNARGKMREKYAPNDEKIVVYMPTWRGTVGKVNHDDQKLIADLMSLSKGLDKGTKLYVKLHPFQRSNDLDGIPNIFDYPENEELYEFLSGADILITDYSSIMYDFINTNQKVILYPYDKEEYYGTRGAYEDIEDYTFPIVYNTDELLSELNNNTPTDMNVMKERFTYKDNLHGAEEVVSYLFKGEKVQSIDEYNIHNGKETVAILSGGFWDNGITTALINTLENIDTSKRNYIVFFGKNKLKPQHYFRVRNLPENVLFYPVPGQINATLFERFINKRYLFSEKFNWKIVEGFLNKLYKRNMYINEYKRIFGDLKIDYFIHYTGFERKYAEMSKHIDPKVVMYVHTDMFQEYKAKKNFNKKVIFGSYEKADRIVLVNENLRENFVSKLPFTKHKIDIVNNFLGEKKVRELANQNLIETLIDVNVDFADSEGFYNNIEMIISEEKEEYMKSINSNRQTTSIDNNGISKLMNESMYEVLASEMTVNQELGFFENLYDIPENWVNEFLNDQHLIISSSKRNRLLRSFVEKLNAKLEKDYMQELLPNTFKQLNLFECLLAENDQYNEINIDLLIEELGVDKLRLIEKLLDKENISFINIGRYDYQKGHDRLVKSFELINRNHPNTTLIIVAPHGALKKETIKLVSESPCRENIFILGRMSNPYALLSMCDAFVLSSHYEGLGLVAFEALAAGTDLITVNLPETVKNLEPDNAIIVDNTQEGIYNGMKQYIQNNFVFKPFDFNKQSAISKREFEEIFKQ